MNEDYLWDKSGETDPEIAELERKLGRLGFKPSAYPLALPSEAPMTFWHRKSFSPLLAIAATLIVLLLAGGLWLGLRGSIFNDGKILQVADSGPRPPIGPIDTTATAVVPKVQQPANSTSPSVEPARFRARPSAERRRELVAMRRSINKAARARREQQQQQLAREGEAAKAQLIRALHITSDALNTVQRKIQGETEERRPIS